MITLLFTKGPDPTRKPTEFGISEKFRGNPLERRQNFKTCPPHGPGPGCVTWSLAHSLTGDWREGASQALKPPPQRA